MEYKDFFDKALSAAEQKYPCSDINTALGNITERAKTAENSSEPGRLHTASESENTHKPSNRIFPILGYTVGAAALIFGCVFGLKFVIENGGLIEGGPRPADTKETTAITSEIPNVTTVTMVSESAVTTPVESDRFLIITDTSMPEPFAVNENPTVYGGTDGWHDNFYDLWKKDFYMIDERLQELAGLERASEIIAGYKAEEAADNEAGNITRYKLDDTQNRYRFIMDAGLSAEDVERVLTGKDNTRGGMVDPDILVTFASKEDTVKENMTDYCIAVGEYVFSPRWLYYHTIEDYKAAGIKPTMLHEKMSKYKELALTDEAWRAFCQKYYAFYFDLDRNSSAVTDLTIFDVPNDFVLDDNAFDILERYFYGEWKTSENNGYPAGTLTLKYDSNQGYYFNLNAVFEYDDMYIMKYGSGGIGNCCIIKNDEPDVMYWTELGFGFGNTAITSSLDSMTKYTERKYETPGLNIGGEISPLGEKYLVHKYGDEFGNIDKNTLDVYSVSMAVALFEDEKGSLYLANGYTSSDIRRYLVAMSDDAVTLGVPYVRDSQELVQTPEYFEVTLTKDANGKWSVKYSSQSTDTSEENEEKNDKETDWGITMNVKDITAEGLTLVISQHGGNYTGELHYDEEYSIERKNGDKWEPLEYLDGAVWHDLAYIVEPNTDKEIKLDWKWLYGTLSAGEYRIAKEFTDFRGTGNYDKQTIYVGFSITDDMTSKLGITLRTAQYNARKMTLQIVQNGGTSDGNIGTSLYRYTIERRENGKWQSYYNYTPQAGVPTLETGLKVKRNDVTEVKFDWRETAGSLPVGDYRLGMTFDCGDIKETKWLEFTIEESMTNELGISIEVMEVSKTGAKLGIDSKGADEQGFAYFDKDLYTLEKKNSSGKWKNVVSTVSTEMFTGKIAMCETGSAGMLETINWSGWCDKLSPGNYRISFKFYTGEGDSYKAVTLYAEFDITDDTPDKLTD